MWHLLLRGPRLGMGEQVGTVVGGGFELGCSEAAQTFSLPLRADFRPALRPLMGGGGGRATH